MGHTLYACCVYSMKTVGAKGGPTKKDLKALRLHLEERYVCGNEIQSDLFHVRTAIRCGEPVESYYYNPKKGATTGGRIRTTDICALCCSSQQTSFRNKVTISSQFFQNC